MPESKNRISVVTIKSLFCGWAFICLLAFKLEAQEPVFKEGQLRSDIAYLKNRLEKKHPTLYLYTPKQQLDLFFDGLSNAIKGPLTELQFYAMLSTVSSQINDGHTIILPSEAVTAYHNKNSRFLPFHFTILNGRLYVDMVCADSLLIKEGDEILEINGRPSTEIVAQLLKRQVKDGYNETYSLWILNNYLREYFSYIFGHDEVFEIKFKSALEVSAAKVNGLLKENIYKVAAAKYADRITRTNERGGLYLQFINHDSCAIMHIGDFHNDALRRDFKQNFKNVVGEFFLEIQKKKPSALILDLRDNQGGDIPNGVFLLSHLIGKPFKVLEAYYKVNSSNKGERLQKTGGQCTGTFNPAQTIFKGRLYVLINGGSFSNSGIVAACLKRYTDAVFIGEETGGSNQTLAGYTLSCLLPETKIRVDIPTRQFVLTDETPMRGRGTVPDYRILPDLHSIINNEDSVIRFTLKLIAK